MSNDELELSTTDESEELELETNLDDTEDVEDLKAQLEREREARRQLTARAKKAEEQLKSMSSQTAPKVEKKSTQTLSAEDVETRILKAQKVTDDEITMLKKIAAVNGTGIIEAQADEMFISFKERREAQEKAEKAKLGVSRGSGSVKAQKNFNTPGLTKEEHKEMWRQANGN
jgi:hypothetical protein